MKMLEKKLWDKYGAIQKSKPFSFGPYYSYQFWNTPRHIIFSLARYKFAMKMIGSNKTILELGCNEGLGAYYLAEFSSHVLGVDFDEEAINWAKANLASKKISFKCGNFINNKYGKFDAVVSYDCIEHIYKKNEDAYLSTVINNLKKTGVFIIGTPNGESHRFSNPKVAEAHVNLFTGDRFTEVLGRYFYNVFLFCQNDEMIHTGFFHLGHYLIGLCCNKKRG